MVRVPAPVRDRIWFLADDKWNITHWNNSEYDSVVKNAVAELDSTKRTALYVKAQQIMDEEAWGILITHGTRVVVSQKNVDLGAIFPNGNLAPWTISMK